MNFNQIMHFVIPTIIDEQTKSRPLTLEQFSYHANRTQTRLFQSTFGDSVNITVALAKKHCKELGFEVNDHMLESLDIADMYGHPIRASSRFPACGILTPSELDAYDIRATASWSSIASSMWDRHPDDGQHELERTAAIAWARAYIDLEWAKTVNKSMC